MTTPILIFTIGNESRGDDALAPLLVRQLQTDAGAQVEMIEDYQLQIQSGERFTRCQVRVSDDFGLK